jgi:hypothetical protein
MPRKKSSQPRMRPPVSTKEDRFAPQEEPVNPRIYYGAGQTVMRPADAGMKPPTKKGR